MKNLIIIGAGGYAKSVLDSVDYMNFRMIGFIDDIKRIGSEHLGYPIIGNTIDCVNKPEDCVYFVAIMHPFVKMSVYAAIAAIRALHG